MLGIGALLRRLNMPYNQQADRQQFANQLDRLLAVYFR